MGLKAQGVCSCGLVVVLARAGERSIHLGCRGSIYSRAPCMPSCGDRCNRARLVAGAVGERRASAADLGLALDKKEAMFTAGRDLSAWPGGRNW